MSKITNFPGLLGSPEDMSAIARRREADPDFEAAVRAENEWFGGIPPWGESGGQWVSEARTKEPFKSAWEAGRVKEVPVRQINAGPTTMVVRVPGNLPLK